MPVILAAASSYRDVAISGETAAVGEVGLTGEVRAVSFLEQRLQELHRLGFQRVLIPLQGSSKISAPQGMELLRVRNIRQAIAVAMD